MEAGSGLRGAALLGFTLINVAPEDAAGTPTGPVSDIGAIIMIGVLVGALIQQRTLRREVYTQIVAPPNPAIAWVEQARRQRQTARDLARPGSPDGP